MAFIVFFAFFYTASCSIDGDRENLKKSVGSFPHPAGAAIRRSSGSGADAPDVLGAAYVGGVPVRISFRGSRFLLFGAQAVIVVTGDLDTVARSSSHLLGVQYEGLIRSEA